jgi:hypothetical protein
MSSCHSKKELNFLEVKKMGADRNTKYTFDLFFIFEIPIKNYQFYSSEIYLESGF